MHFPMPYVRVGEDAALCRLNGLALTGHVPAPAFVSDGRAGPGSALRSALRPAWRRVRDSFPVQAVSLVRRVMAARSLIRRERVSCVLLGADVVHYDTAVYIQAAHREGVPAIVVAGWMIHQDENAEAFRYEPSLSMARLSNRITAALLPRWSYRYKGVPLLRLPAGHIWARELLGLAPPLPWVLHSGGADRILVDSEFTRAACLREGLPDVRVRMVGAAVHDRMHRVFAEPEKIRTEVMRRLGIPDRGLPLLVWALPPDEFYRTGGRPGCPFPHHRSLVTCFATLAAAVSGWQPVFCPHPSIPAAVREAAGGTGVPVWPGHTAELIPLCSLFVASGSTTVQWAAACGKPVLDYDVYHYGQRDYAGMAGRIAVDDQEEFERQLARLTGDADALSCLTTASRCERHCWGDIDGGAAARLAAAVDAEMDARGIAP